MKVSIVVPVYNVAPYIEQFARSVFEQTLEDIEHVFVDDCSPDSSMDILLSVLEEYPHRKQKVKIVRHEKNMGISVTRKDGYMKTTGEYVIYVDSDDYLEPRMLELMYAKAKEHDADMIVCDIYLYYKENCNVLKTAPKEEGENGEKIYYIGGLSYDNRVFYIPKYLVSNNYIEEKYYNRDNYPEFFEEDWRKYNLDNLDIGRVSYLILRVFNIERISEGSIDSMIQNGSMLKLVERAKVLKK